MGEYRLLAARFEHVNPDAMQRAITDLMQSYPGQYPNGAAFLKQVEQYRPHLPKIKQGLLDHDPQAIPQAKEIIAFQQEVLLANPLLDFDRLLLIKRKPLGNPRRATGDPANDKGLGKYLGIPQQSSWQLHTMKNISGWDNEIAVLSPVRPDGELTTLFRPEHGALVNEMDLHFNAEKLMFSMPDQTKHWQIYEMQTDGENVRQLSGSDQPDVHNLDSCYLPNGNIAYVSTAPFQGVPCNASVNVGMLYVMDGNGKNIRQLCFEQDHNFCPTVMNDGRILYLRWEYTDIPHVWARFLFTMNPDGTCQREFFGSGSYWPNAIFFARPVPNHPTQFVGIVTGHHVGRVGELVLFDPAKSRLAKKGVIQRIPGYGKPVKPLIQDKLTLDTWPKFLHPYPLSEKYFLVACKPSPVDLWGIYLVDVFDNIVLVKEIEDYALLEPIPLRKIPTPPVIPDRVDLSRQDAIVYIENIYAGPGLKNVPKDAVKKLRLFTYHFAYRTIAGINHRVGADGPWEPKRVLGTVSVEPDGSAYFRIPANTPISIQPLDEQNRSLQLMRSWMTAMPGEIVSCVGCHEKQNSAPPNFRSLASRRRPEEIKPWYGPVRGFSFMHEVQPVLDKYCVSCHDGSPREDGLPIPDLRRDQGKLICYKNAHPKAEVIYGQPRDKLVLKYGGVFDPSYIELRKRVRVGGLESDLRLLEPCEFRANTSELIQMLQKGHHGVELDADAWNRLYTWIDLNAPCHGTWHEVVGQEKLAKDHERRRDLRALYGGIVEDPEFYPEELKQEAVQPLPPPKPIQKRSSSVTLAGWPIQAEKAAEMQSKAESKTKRISLNENIHLELVWIPAGDFVMGDNQGHPDETPLTKVSIQHPFWMSRFEISNRQYTLFDPTHDSRYEHKGSWMFNEWDLGWDLNAPEQPVLRVSQEEAKAFCAWLSERIGMKVDLPTEAQWEYACRAGTDSPFSFGTLDSDFSAYGNMADRSIRNYVYDVRDQYPPDLVPREERFNDHFLVSAPVGTFKPNVWGLYDMHGNVWEWTRTAYKPYPYRENDGRNTARIEDEIVVRGGSWYDRPTRCRSSFRLKYPAWQKVFNVGFRVVVEAGKDRRFTARAQ